MSLHSGPIQGVGIGLRSCHFDSILSQKPQVPWFEIISENYMNQGARVMTHLLKVRESYPVCMHGVSLSIGSCDPLNQTYLKHLKALAHQVEPVYISDHLCWSSLHGRYVPDLLPLPYTSEALEHVASRVQAVQEYLGRRILIENVSSYLEFNDNQMHEWVFLSELVKKADCDILLDVNNIVVSAVNHGFDPIDYLKVIPKERVKEIHLGGYEEHTTHLIDTHGAMVHEPVWALYEKALNLFGQVPTLIEWDNNIPEFDVLQEQATIANRIREKVHGHPQTVAS